MRQKRRSGIAGGVVLIVLGGLALVAQIVPGWQAWISWPVIIMGVGLFLLLLGLLTGAPQMATPACIVGGIGGLLYWQNWTGNWDSWSYAWALIPGFVGLGVLVSGILEGKARKGLRDGGQLILISLVMFVIFGTFFGALGLGGLGQYWPVLLIALGALGLIRAFFRPR